MKLILNRRLDCRQSFYFPSQVPKQVVKGEQKHVRVPQQMDHVPLICIVVCSFQTILYTLRCQGSLRSQGQQQLWTVQPVEKHNIWAEV